MEGFKIPLLVCLLIFHSSYSGDISGFGEGIVDSAKTAIKEVQEATLPDGTNNLVSAFTESLKSIAKESTQEIRSLVEIHMNITKTMMREAKALLENTNKILTGIRKQGEAKTFDNLTEVKNQVTDKIGKAVQGTLHLFTEEVRYPQEAFGFFSLKKEYNKKDAPSNTSVRGWMKPTFVADIDSMKRKMGLEIYFVLMWQEDSSRVNWALEKQMENGSAFSFSPAILEDMWTPDVVFANQVSLQRVSSTIKNESDAVAEIVKLPCRNNSRGLCEELNLTNEVPGIKIFIKQTINVEVNCPDMLFGDFPFDTQTCLFIVKDLHWKENPKNFELVVENLSLGNNLTSTEFHLSVETSSEGKIDARNGFRMRMTRKTTVYIYTYFVPCGLMVVVSWISFSISVDAVPGRLGLLLTLLLMTINMNNSAAQAIPTSEKICPLIVWILLSMGFISFALFEYFALLLLVRYGKEVDAKVEPSKKNPSAFVGKRAMRILFVDQLSLVSVPLVYALVVAVFMAKHA